MKKPSRATKKRHGIASLIPVFQEGRILRVKALIAMSGGVDSSVAAYLTQQAGYECAGCTMKLYDNADAGLSQGKTCCSLNDLEDARAVAERLGMPYYVFNYTEEFREKVIGAFVTAYEAGITPNPCIDCNHYLKFDALLERALLSGYDKLVSGHYARIRQDAEGYHLLKGLDPGKDQSYVLYSLSQGQLAHLLFPLGELSKEAVRALARQQGLVNAAKPDSQDICFVPEGDYARVIEQHRGRAAEPGDFVDESGRILGRHRGLIHYTIGQRRGLGLALPASLYVLRLDTERNQVVLGPEAALFSHRAQVKKVNWISGKAPEAPLAAQVKIRYRQAAAEAKLIPKDEDTLVIEFSQAQRAITPGQAAVFYQGEEVLGGGTLQ